MKKQHKFGALLLAVAMLAATTACSQGNSENGSSANSSSAPSAPSAPVTDNAGSGDLVQQYAPEEGKKYHFTWIGYQMAPIDEAHPKVLEYFNEKLNVDIEVVNIENSQWDEILNLKLASGEIPDRLLVRNENNLNQYYAQDVLAEIPDEVYAAYMPNTYARFQEEKYAPYSSVGRIDGTRFGIADEYQFHNQFRTPLVMRGDWMEAVGVTKEPETLDEFEELMYRFSNDDPDGNGQKDTYGLSKTGLEAVYGAYGVLDNWYDVEGKLVWGPTRPEMKDCLTRLNKWYQDGVIDPEFITGENQGGYWAISHSFCKSRIGASAHGGYYHWNNDRLSDVTRFANIDELYKLNPAAVEKLVYPQPPVGPTGERGLKQGNFFTGEITSFGKQLEEEPDRFGKLMQVIDYISSTSEENYLTAYCGIQGEMWEKIDPELGVVYMGEYLTGERKIAEDGGHKVLTAIIWDDFDAVREPYSLKFGTEHQFNLNGVTNQFTSSVPAQAQYETELKKLYEEMLVAVITGAQPIDSYDAFAADWRAAGGDELEKEVNDWYAAK